MRFARVFLAVAGLFLFTQAGWAHIDTVRTRDFQFVPSSLTIHAGDTVVWKVTQECCIQHTTTRLTTPMSWDSGPLDLNQTFQLVFNQTGTFNYICSSHNDLGMVGSITVQALPPAISALGWLGLLLLGASLTATSIWILERRRETV